MHSTPNQTNHLISLPLIAVHVKPPLGLVPRANCKPNVGAN